MPCMFMAKRRPNARTGLAPTPAFEVTYRAALGQRDINPALLDLTIDSDDDEPAYEDGNQPVLSKPSAPNPGRTGTCDRKPRRPSVFDAPQLLITPRMAAKMYWRCHSLVEIMEHRTAVNTTYMASLLPAEAQWVARNDPLWWEQFSQSLRRTLERLSQGRDPKPTCNGDVIACKIVLDICADKEARDHNEDLGQLLQHLPCHNLDSDFDLMRDLLLSDYDIVFASELQLASGYTSGMDTSSSPEPESLQQAKDYPGRARSLSPLSPREATTSSRGLSFTSMVQLSLPASPCLAIHETVSDASRAYLHPRDWFSPFHGNATPCNSLRPSLDNPRISPAGPSRLTH